MGEDRQLDHDVEVPPVDPAALLDRIPEMVVVVGSDLRLKYVNQRLLDVMGYRRDQVIGADIFDFVHPDDHDYMVGTWLKRAARPGETGILIEARGRNANGTWRPVEMLGLSLLGDGIVDGMVLTMRELMPKVEHGDGAGRIRSMLDRSTDVVLLLDQDGAIRYANRRLTSTLGVDQDDAIGAAFTSLVPAAEVPAVLQWLDQLIAAGDGGQGRVRVPSGERSGRIIDWHGTNQLGDPLIDGIIVSGRDVTELAEMERRVHAQNEVLRHLAGHDVLTGLLNRAAFAEELTAHVEARRRAGDDGDVVVLFCDLDRFKEVNDTHGHAVGDRVLRAAADRLRGCLREGDLVARWGGDEYTVLLQGSPPEAAVTGLIERICERVGAPVVDAAGSEASVGVTVGASRARVATVQVSDLLAAADAAMYARKPGRLRTDRKPPVMVGPPLS